MSFSLVTGLMGGGKSYFGVETAIQAAKEGALIHTNLPLVQEEWEKAGLWDKVVKLPRDPTKWITFTKKEVDGETVEVPSSEFITGGAEGAENLVIFDEASLTFRTKDQAKNKDIHQPVFDLVALSRHVGLEIIFLAQDENNVSSDLRRLAQWRTRCVAVKEIPMIGQFAVRFVGDFKRLVYKGGMGKTVFMISYHRFKQSVGAMYKTHGMAESVAMRVEATRTSKGMDTSKKKGLLLFIGGPLLCLLLIGGAMWKAKRDIYDKQMEKRKKEETAPATAAPAPLPSAKEAEKPRGGWRAKEWHPDDELILSGRLRVGSTDIVYARGGYRLAVGRSFRGEPIVEHLRWGEWHYFNTIFGRLIVVRPIEASEREELPPVTVQGQPPPPEVVPPGVTPATPMTDAISSGIQTLKGT